jgi:hypothetical protein
LAGASSKSVSADTLLYRRRLEGFVPFVGERSHSRGTLDDAADRGLLGVAWFAFPLGFAHGE